jgi:hypothetical protein
MRAVLYGQQSGGFLPVKYIFVLLGAMPCLAMPAERASTADIQAKGGRPAVSPDPRSRAIPELVCTGERTLVVRHDSTATERQETPLRLRLRGNLVYLGESANTEKFSGIINRIDRRRWTSGNATLVLDEPLQAGAWVVTQLSSTRITSIRCTPFAGP